MEIFSAAARGAWPPGRRFVDIVGYFGDDLGNFGSHADHHQQAQFRRRRPNIDVGPLRPQIHVVHIGQITPGEGALPGFHRSVSFVITAALRSAGNATTIDATVAATYRGDGATRTGMLVRGRNPASSPINAAESRTAPV